MATSNSTMTGARAESSKPLLSFEAAAFVGVVAVLAVLPHFLTDFTTFTVTKVLIYALAIMGLNLLTGINGQFSLGHGAFFAAGAYTTAIMMEQMGVNYVLTLPAAALISFVLGFLFGFPALRLEGIYLALATFALAVATPQLLKLSVFQDVTGGVMGIILFKPDVPFGLPISQDQWLYYFTLIVGLLLYWLARNLVNSRTGRALMAIRDNPIAARSMGVNLAMYKATAFGISAAFTGVAGGLFAIVIAFVAPDAFTFFISVSFLVGMVVGGVGWLPGALIGAAFIVYVPNEAEKISQGLSGAFFGIFLILMIYLAPNGAGGLIQAGVARIKRLF